MAKDIGGAVREVCLWFPDTSEDRQFGFPVWRAGKKTFAGAYYYQ